MSAVATGAAPTRPAARPMPARLTYQPTLDGLRGLALLGMLAFHNGFGWITGGFLSVSTFFTLSGFLITSLLLVERRDRGRIALGAFWGRRFRRLLPAAMVGLVLVLAMGMAVGNSLQQAELRGDVLWSVAYLANWHFIFEGTSYADIFSAGAESYAQHYWTLAIEEQFYLAFPLLMVGGFALVGRHRGRLALLLGALWLVSVELSVLYDALGWPTDRIYFGTDTRASELLIGALLAVALGGGTDIPDARLRRTATVAGPVALAVMLLLWTSTDLATPWLYSGGFAAYGVLSTVVVVAAVQASGPLRRALALDPLPWIGRVSYGAYLYHWPIFLALREATDLDPWPRFAVGLVATFGLAALSYHVLEMPVRTGSTWRGARAQALLGAMTAAVVVLALVVTPNDGATIDLDPSSIEQASDGVALEGAPSVAFFGDSTMLTLTKGLGPVLDADQRIRRVGGSAALGCGIGRGGWRQYLDEPVAEVDADCWSEPWRETMDQLRPDVAVVMAGPWDVTDRWLPTMDPETDPPVHPGDPRFDEYIRNEMLAATDLLAAGGSKVVWITSPYVELGGIDGEVGEVEHPRAWVDDEGRAQYPGSYPPRMRRYNNIIRNLPAQRPGIVEVVDLAAWLADWPSGPTTPDLKPDGVHFTDEGAETVASSYVAPGLVRALADLGFGADDPSGPPSTG